MKLSTANTSTVIETSAKSSAGISTKDFSSIFKRGNFDPGRSSDSLKLMIKKYYDSLSDAEELLYDEKFTKRDLKDLEKQVHSIQKELNSLLKSTSNSIKTLNILAKKLK